MCLSSSRIREIRPIRCPGPSWLAGHHPVTTRSDERTGGARLTAEVILDDGGRSISAARCITAGLVDPSLKKSVLGSAPREPIDRSLMAASMKGISARSEMNSMASNTLDLPARIGACDACVRSEIDGEPHEILESVDFESRNHAVNLVEMI